MNRLIKTVRGCILDVDSSDILKRGYVWNSLASIITAMSSVSVLLIAARFAGEEAGADLSIAVAIVNVLMNIGHMNIMGYQISDIEEKYAFSTYFRQRCYSVGMMIVIAIGISYIKYGITEKMLIICLYCIYKAINVFCELFQCRYQQKGRVDIASELNFIKVFVPDIFLCIMVIVTRGLLFAIMGAILIELVIVLGFNGIVWESFASFKREKAYKIISLTKEALPLFISAFATAYILNSAKYAIDNNLPSKSQLIYTVLLLPATTVHMIAGFAYRPVLTIYAELWNEKKFKILIRKTLSIIGVIVIGSLGIVIIRGYILAILSWAYGVEELCEYNMAFGLLLMAGGINAVNVIACYIITIIREQKYLYVINTLTFILSLVIPELLVQEYGINGAAFSYLTLMFVQLLGFLICFIIVKHHIKNQKA